MEGSNAQGNEHGGGGTGQHWMRVGRYLGLEALLPWTCGFHMQCIGVEWICQLLQKNAMRWIPFALDEAPSQVIQWKT